MHSGIGAGRNANGSPGRSAPTVLCYTEPILAMNIPYVLCFLTRGERVLMLERLRPPNQGLWNGVGGHIEPGETPLQACLREVEEETGFVLPAARYGGLLTWEGFETPPGGLHIFSAEAPAGEPGPCSEGRLEWQPRGWVFSAPEVVSNIHVFGPQVLGNGAAPRHWHFVYAEGKILRYTVESL